MDSPSRLGKAPRGARGFSLIELLCVLVILIILATLMDSRMAGSAAAPPWNCAARISRPFPSP